MWRGDVGDSRVVGRAVVAMLLEKLEGGGVEVMVPGEVKGGVPVNQAKHLLPEVFVQLSGYTEFTCGREVFRLRAGEVCVMPRGMPHAERVGEAKGEAFCNLVIMYGHPRLLYHLAVEKVPGKPGGILGGSVECVTMARHVDYLDEVVRVSRQGGEVRDAAVRGLMLAYVADVWESLARREEAGNREPVKVSQVRQLVASRLTSRELCVGWLAGLVRCHADYLSHVFRRETGITLTRYINEQRVQQARDLLERSALSIKEVASAVGYGDAGYFTRVFRRMTGVLPGAYRAGRRGGIRGGG